jgi:uncharacterized protein YcfL
MELKRIGQENLRRVEMKKMWLLGMMAAAAVLLAGCASPNTSGFTVGADADAGGGLSEYLQVDNARLSRMLTVEDVVVGQTKNGLMRANVKLTSRLNKDYTAQSKFAWFDEDGMELDPDGDPWRPLVLHGKETKTIQGVAPNANAASFKLRVRAGERTRWMIHW